MTPSLSTLAGLWLTVAGSAPTESVAPEAVEAEPEAVEAEPESPDDSAAPPPSEGDGMTSAAPPPEPASAAETADPNDGAENTEDEPAAPAPLPEGPMEAPPADTEPRAFGGAMLDPLPPAPEPEDPSTITEGPWRGRGWLGLGLALSIPAGGTPPGAGSVFGVAGEITLGWRVNRVLGLHTALSSYAHDAGRRSVTSDGAMIDEVAHGRITAFDLVTARVYLPRPRRIEPWAEAGLGVGIHRGPFADYREAVGLARTGLGVDFWLAPTFSLGVMGAYRLAIIDRAVGHGLRAGVDLGIHW